MTFSGEHLVLLVWHHCINRGWAMHHFLHGQAETGPFRHIRWPIHIMGLAIL